MTDFNIANLKQDIGLPGTSKKLQKGNAGKEQGQLMPFACIIGHACRIAKQKTEKVLFNFSPGKGKMSVPFKKGNTKGQKGLFNIEPQNNILGAGKDKTEKTNQSLPVKGNGLAESPHGVILKGEATNDSNLFMSASKGKGKTNRSFSGKINLQSQSGGQNQIGTGKDEGGGQRSEAGGQRSEVGGQRAEVGGQRSEVRGQRSKMEDTPGLLKFNLKNAVAVKGKSAVEPAGTEKNSFTPVNSGGKNNIGNSLKHLGLKGEAKVVVCQSALADEAQVRVGADALIGPFGKRALDSGIRNGKNDTALFKDGKNDTALFKDGKNVTALFKDGKNDTALFKDGKNDTALFKDGKNVAAVFRDGGLKGNGAGKDEGGGQRSEAGGQRSEVGGQRSEGRGQKAEMEVLKFNLKNAVAVKGKSAVKNFFTPVNSGGKNNIGNSLKPLGLNGEETIKIPHRGTPQPEGISDRGFSAGGHNNTTFHVSNSSSAVNESVSSYDIKPTALMNQIAAGAKMSGRVRIVLNPPSLGTLDMDVIVRNNKVHVMLQVENNDVRQILQSNLESLKSSLRNHGLVADTINVSVQDKSDGANHGADYRSGQSETLFKESKNREGNEEDQNVGQDSLNYDPSSLEEENQSLQSDGRVSLFA